MGSTPRTGTVSGSRAATILGLNPYATQFEIWQLIEEELNPGFNSLHGYVMPEPPDNAAIRWGSAFESANIQVSESRLGVKILDREREYESAGRLCRRSCHIDGRIEPLTLYEGKTTSINAFRNSWGDPDTDGVPRHYHVQAQHNMAEADLDECVFGVLVFPKAPEEWEEMGWEATLLDQINGVYRLTYKDEYRIKPEEWAAVLADMGFYHTYRVERNNYLIAAMHDHYDEFWERYVLPQIPPDPMNVDDIKRMCPEPKGTIIVTDEMAAWAKERKDIGKEIGESGNMEKRREQLKVLFLDEARKIEPVMDDESTEQWIFRDAQGNKVGSFGRDARGSYRFT